MTAPLKNGPSSIKSWTGCASTKPIQGTRTCQWRFWTLWFCNRKTDRTKCSADWIKSSSSRSQTSTKWYHSRLNQEGISQWDKAKTWTWEIRMPARIKACMGVKELAKMSCTSRCTREVLMATMRATGKQAFKTCPSQSFKPWRWKTTTTSRSPELRITYQRENPLLIKTT